MVDLIARLRQTVRRLRPDGALARFGMDTRGSLAVWFGIAIVPLLFVVGAGLDYGRGVNLKAQMQGAADAAALAGASVYVNSATATAAKAAATSYMQNFATAMGTAAGITYTVSTTSNGVGASATMYGVTVAVKGKIANSIMSLATKTEGIGVTATAKNPVYTLTLTLSSYSSSAADANTVSYYIVPSANGAPDPASTTPFFTNSGSNSTTPITIQLTASQKVGFMLKNVTGGRTGSYGNNGYGGVFLSTHYFFSHMMPPSTVAYPTVSKDCSLQVTTTSASVTTGSCFTSLPKQSAINCATTGGTTYIYSWNDMGGTTDDKDYNDMVYTVKCSQNDPSIGQGVVLTN